MRAIISLVSHFHLFSTVGKTILKIGKGLLHSNFGLIGLDRILSHFGIG